MNNPTPVTGTGMNNPTPVTGAGMNNSTPSTDPGVNQPTPSTDPGTNNSTPATGHSPSATGGMNTGSSSSVTEKQLPANISVSGGTLPDPPPRDYLPPLSSSQQQQLESPLPPSSPSSPPLPSPRLSSSQPPLDRSHHPLSPSLRSPHAQEPSLHSSCPQVPSHKHECPLLPPHQEQHELSTSQNNHESAPGKVVHESNQNSPVHEHSSPQYHFLERSPNHTQALPLTPEGIKLEICVDSVASAVAAERGGASRVELCTDLFEGGLTPSLGLVMAVTSKISIPVFVMIRPRAGDFCYSDLDFEVMKNDINFCSQFGVTGIVFGILTPHGDIDIPRCKILLELAREKNIKHATFHRAFDMARDPLQALEDIIGLGFERILTSGQDISCMEGLDNLLLYNQKANNRIIIVPGGGVTEKNVNKIIKSTGVSEIHASARSIYPSAMVYQNRRVYMGADLKPDEFSVKVTNADRVQHFVNITKI
eukprot:TRINITY_DN5200_c0_g1_i1.p1 TRINITY_DN5200_c0_g1~~TRINITY_DN5200_c0_g1_i1.p1  ORF type:complete len:488 (+),score=114.47 TRINITY_DN5200_c0_g1_i1:30-1466(+)